MCLCWPMLAMLISGGKVGYHEKVVKLVVFWSGVWAAAFGVKWV